MPAIAVVHTAPQSVRLFEYEVATPRSNEVVIDTLYSAISPGTESMIYQGNMPRDSIQDETIKSLSGNFEYPFRYGYSLVGSIVKTGADVDPVWLGKKVFAFHPHCSKALVSIDDCLAIPEDIRPQAALFLPNMETAVNFIMDANPMIGSTVMVFGLGVVGLLTTGILSLLPLHKLIVADPLINRIGQAKNFGALQGINPQDEQQWSALLAQLFNQSDHDGVDLVFELSGNMEALDQAVKVAGFNGKIIVGSWYGMQSKAINMGNHFHKRRLQFISSQVSTLNPAHSGRWDKNRRIRLAWDMIRRLNPEQLISHSFAPSECSKAFATNDKQLDNAIQVIFRYKQ